VPKRLNFVFFNELFAVDFPTFPPPMKLQYIYKTFEDKKQKSYVEIE
jgi:hypothetical protein